MAKATRQAFGEAIARLGEKYPEIVILDADLSKSTKSDIFAKKFPDRFFEMGIAEANMIGTAAGLAFAGKLPFLCSFGCFLTGRYDTIRISAVYAQANIRLVGTHAGLGIGEDGHSQMGLEDVSLMRALPTMGVFQPMDSKETELIVKFLVEEWKGPAYLRLTRQTLPDLYPEGKVFEPCKLLSILENKNPKALLLGTGAGVSEAVGGAEMLSKQGISTCVWSAHALKPFDEKSLHSICHLFELVVTIEDHTVVGGLGTCVAEAFAKLNKHPPLLKLGVQDTFGESGTPAELFSKHGFSASEIVKNVKRFLNGSV
ncbi:MAG: transketolase family protein [Deltaproteobacteria bacterium]|nr:transketolase family protein [Deltaproteobacteria bacterium]